MPARFIFVDDGNCRFEDRGFGAVEPFDEAFNAACVVENNFGRLFAAIIAQNNVDARVQEREFAQAVMQRAEIEFGFGEGLRRRQEA